MSSYELIKDLEKKLELYRTWSARPPVPPNRIHELVANYIFEAESYPGLLNKQTVKDLIEERLPWPVRDGGTYCLAYPVSVRELEAARVISFPNGALSVLRTLAVSADMPAKLRDQLNAHRFLYDIRYKVGELVTPHLRIPAGQVTPHEVALLAEYLVKDGEFVKISIDQDDIFGVGTYLWKRLRAQMPSLEQAFSVYVTKMSLASDRSLIFDIDLSHEINSGEYLQAAYSYIMADQTLHDGWTECAADVAIGDRGIDSIVRIQHWATQSTDRVNEDMPTYSQELDLTLVAGVINSIVSRPPCTLLEGADWWNESTRHGYSSRERMTENLVWLIIKHERNLYSPGDSFPYTRRLIDSAISSPKMLGMLFEDTSYPPFLCFLLSNFQTNHIGLINLYTGLKSHQRPISDKVAYEQLWQDLVWTQGLEIYSKSYPNRLDGAELRGTLERLCEMLIWFAKHELGYNSRGKSIIDTRLPSLKKTIDSIRHIAELDDTQYLVNIHAGLISEIVESRLASLIHTNGSIPVGEWLILFWCLEWASLHKQQFQNEQTKAICDVLVDSYFTVLSERMNNHCNASDDPLAFDEFNWKSICQIATKKQYTKLVYALEESKASDLPKDSSRQRSFIYAVRMHLRLLLQLHEAVQCDEAQNELAIQLLSLVEQFGFNQDKYSGALDFFVDNSDYSPIHLWPAFSDATNNFSEENFTRLIQVLKARSAPLSSLFVLLERTAPLHRRNILIKEISERNLEEEDPHWIPQVFRIAIMAANNYLPEIAEHFLDFASKHSHKTHKNKIDELVAKIALKKIFDATYYTDNLRIKALREFQITSEDRQVKNELQQFKAYLIATVNVDTDASKALRMFSDALRTAPTLQNATGLIRAALAHPDSTTLPLPLEEYFQIWMQVYIGAHDTRKAVELSDSELNCILQLSLKLSRLDDFSNFWGVATPQQHKAYDFAPMRAEYLRKVGRGVEIAEYLRALRQVHQQLPQSVLEEFSSIEKNLEDEHFSLHISTANFPTISSSLDSMRATWLRIRNLEAYDQCQIFMDPLRIASIDDYLIDIVDQVGNELLLRRANLQRKKLIAPSASTILLDEEDMINDWFVSLFRHRMNFAGWTVHDQSRMGTSSSGKSVGEIDGRIEDCQGNFISLIEAFRQGQNIDRTKIREHLDKISKYNSVGASPVMVVVYTATDDFTQLCSQYARYILEIEYEGFDPGASIPLTRKLMKKVKATSAYYEEIRYINQVPIKIYHQLLDLKPPLI
jgi:hypothetical protein